MTGKRFPVWPIKKPHARPFRPAAYVRDDAYYLRQKLHARRRAQGPTYGILALVFMICGGMLVKACEALSDPAPAEAQDVPQHVDPDSVDLGTVCVHERGWSHSTDCAGYLETITRVQHARRHRTFGQAARLYAGNAFNPNAPRNRWAADLSADGHEPRHWPHHLPWNRRPHTYRHRWASLVDYAWSLMHGKDWIPCGELAEHWASCTHPTSPLFRLLVCPGAADCFYARR